jgi:hypothetical protein
MAAEKSDVAPWTIRGVEPEARNAAIEAAKRADMNLGEWIGRAIRTEIQKEKQGGALVPPVRQEALDSPTGLSDVERIVSAMRDLAAAGVPVNEKHAARVTSALVARLPRLGKPAVGQKPPARQTGQGGMSDAA